MKRVEYQEQQREKKEKKISLRINIVLGILNIILAIANLITKLLP